MHNTIIIIFLAAVAIGFMHTLMGQDHYVPIIAIAKIRKWALPKTALITLICGTAHVFSAAIFSMATIITIKFLGL
jgi:nickel/cobalt exporter